jgi:tetratricopeptide (TPR) repeat protein
MEALLMLADRCYSRRDFEQARELAERVLAMAEQYMAPAMLAGAHFVLGLVQFMTGQFPAAREHFECAVELFGTGPLRNYLALFAQAAHNLLADALIILGYPSAGLSRTQEMLTAARRRSDPFLVASALTVICLRHLLLRETQMLVERADELLSIATEHEIPHYAIYAAFYRGWATSAAGRSEEGIAEMRQSISDPVIAEGTVIPLLLTILAETCGKSGRVEEALDVVAVGLTTAEQPGWRPIQAELHRIKGDLLMMQDVGNVMEAERCLHTAIDVARRQSARFLELRATVSLARLLASRGGRDEAAAMLTDIYGWFTEGYEFPDLKDAKALLDELTA